MRVSPLGSFGDAAQKDRRRFQIPVGMLDLGVAEIGGERQHMTVRIGAGFQILE